MMMLEQEGLSRELRATATAAADSEDVLARAEAPPEPSMPGWRVMVPVYLTSLTLPLDDSVVLPSLWGYVQSLGGDAFSYGLILVTYYLVRSVSIPFVGVLVDRASYGLVLAWLILLGVFASLLYAAAPALGGILPVVLARALLGVSSAASVACLAYVAQYVPTSHRTGAYTVCFALQRACVPLAPLLNIGIVRLPEARLGPFPLNQYTYAGFVIAALNGVILLGLLLLEEPARSQEQLSTPTPEVKEVCRNVARTGAYISYIVSFQNNWTNQVVLWTLPIITSQLYPSVGVVGNSLLIACGGVTGLLTVCLLPPLARKHEDRWVLLLTQAMVGPALVPFAFLYGCRGVGEAPPVWCLGVLNAFYNVGFLAQMPANNAIYTKLVGGRSQGVYVSLLELSKTLARAIAGYMIGAAYAALGPCLLWGLTISIWMLQFVPFLLNWRRLGANTERTTCSN